jgi:hypothetical protein
MECKLRRTEEVRGIGSGLIMVEQRRTSNFKTIKLQTILGFIYYLERCTDHVCNQLVTKQMIKH